ncbi:NAD(P)H-hydrate dehydratase [Desulfurobacterium sp.]
MFVLRADEMGVMDRDTIEGVGIPGVVLMENAARGVVSVIRKKISGNKVAVVCGKGNNGGDGLAIARNLVNQGFLVKVFLLSEPEKLKGDAKINYDILRGMKVQVFSIVREIDLGDLLSGCQNVDFVVDAIFGTGLSKPVEGFYAAAIDIINRSGTPVISVDVPSGLFADTGNLPSGAFVRANWTVTFAFPKIVHIMPPACKYVGEVFVVDISIPEKISERHNPGRRILTIDDVSDVFPEREINSHKYNYGFLAVIGGSCGKTGAPSMSATAALRTGVGLVSAIVPRDLNPVFEVKLTEPMTIPIMSAEKGHFNANSLDEVVTSLKNGKFSAVAIGPGLGWNRDTEVFVREILENVDLPFVIDADALNALSKNVEVLKNLKKTPILTPHGGEFSRLTGLSVAEIMADPITCAVNFAREYGVVLVLKGGRTIIATPEGEAFINVRGNPGMATAGTGDVLTGIIGALVAMGVSVDKAAAAGVFLHAVAGDMAKEKYGEESLIATDLIEFLPEAIKLVKRRVSKDFEIPFVSSLREIVGV